jgi:hypothetical protein
MRAVDAAEVACVSLLPPAAVIRVAQGLTMFKNMPRQMFGRVQSKLFPM